MLIRPQERALVGETTRELRFLTVDELHVYRGRQGADVAMPWPAADRRARYRGILAAHSFQPHPV
jgi:ATP-dependent helicase YprA (DUF1998 family)